MLHIGRAGKLIGWLCVFSAAACSLPKRIVEAPIAVVHSSPSPQLAVTIAPDANQNSPLAVDLVLVKDSKLLKTLTQTPVADWFRGRREWESNNPKQLQVLSWEWTPGQAVEPIPLKLDGDIKGALVFANYNAPGAKPVPVDPSHGLALSLLGDSFTVGPAQ